MEIKRIVVAIKESALYNFDMNKEDSSKKNISESSVSNIDNDKELIRLAQKAGAIIREAERNERQYELRTAQR